MSLLHTALTPSCALTRIIKTIQGYPNVGKSSILNSLKRFRAVGVSPRPGFTTSLQEVVLDKNIRLIDSPGVVFDDDASRDGANAMLRNGVDADSVSDPLPAISELLGRCTIESLMMTYSVPAFPTGPEGVLTFLAMVARSKGRVLKGGIPDKMMAARLVIRDWNQGKIPYFSTPPTTEVEMGDTSAGSTDAKIVSKFSEEFDVSKIMAAHDKELMEGLEDVDEMDFVQMTSSSRPQGDSGADKVVRYLNEGGDESSDSEMEGDDDAVAINTQMEEAEDFFGE